MRSIRLNKRRGMTILEAVAALMVLTAGLVGTAKVLVLWARERLASEQLLAAQFEAANVLEQIAATSYDKLTPDALNELKLSPESQSALPGGRLRVTVSSSTGADGQRAPDDSAHPPHKLVRVEVLWSAEEDPGAAADESSSSASAIPDHSVQLSAWKYAPPTGD